MQKQKTRQKAAPASLQRISASERGERILAAANQLFLEKGFAETSLNDVIRLSGGSKATIIEQFTNKAGLFAAVIESQAVNLAEHLPPATQEQSPDQVLQQYGETILQFYLQPAALLAYRGIVAEGAKHPDIARAFYLRGHEHVVEPIAKQLRAWHTHGVIANVNFHDEADRFTHMLRNGLYEQSLLGIRQRATKAGIRKQVAGAVRVFLAGLQK
jgi:TetR/AcrR family transcriptional regulator, mexJK operon transcriptional repressor